MKRILLAIALVIGASTAIPATPAQAITGAIKYRCLAGSAWNWYLRWEVQPGDGSTTAYNTSNQPIAYVYAPWGAFDSYSNSEPKNVKRNNGTQTKTFTLSSSRVPCL